MKLRWQNSQLFKSNKIDQVWQDHFGSKSRHCLFISVHGFDPRMNDALKRLIKCAPDQLSIDCLLLLLDEGGNSYSRNYQAEADLNAEELRDLINSRGIITERTVEMKSSESYMTRTGSQNIFTAMQSEILDGYSDVVIDISSMPRSIYFPLIKKVMLILDELNEKSEKKKNLFVTIVENAELDFKIVSEGLDEFAQYIYGFMGNTEIEENRDKASLWIPLLGENREDQNKKAYSFVKEDDRLEIVPIIPFPAKDPLRGDKIVKDYRTLLFEELDVERQNIIYAAEQNPFDSYRQIYKTIVDYNNALEVIGGCKVHISPFCSKLISMGSLLAAYELDAQEDKSVAVVNIEANGYKVADKNILNKENINGELFLLWLVGDPFYE